MWTIVGLLCFYFTIKFMCKDILPKQFQYIENIKKFIVYKIKNLFYTIVGSLLMKWGYIDEKSR